MKGFLFMILALLLTLAIYQKFLAKKIETMNFGFSQD
jgi:hypothetical protein